MKKKVCFYLNVLLVGGIEKVLLELLKNIDHNKYEVSLLIAYKLGEVEKLKKEIPKNIEIKYLLTEEFLVKGKRKKVLGELGKTEKILDESISFVRKAFIKKRALEFIKDKDVVVDFDMTLAPYTDKINKKIITFCHFSPKNYNRGIKSRQVKHGKRLNAYDKVVVISDDMKKEMLEMYPFLEKKVIRIYNSFNIEELEKKSLEIKEEYRKIIEENNYILAIGRIEETQKDFTTLIEAYNLIKDRITEKLFIIGDGRHKNQLIDLVEKYNLQKRIIFLGFISNPYPFIKGAKLFVHSSKFEGLPTVLIEALILGKAIVATDCPTGPREILSNGKNGILTNIFDAKSLGKGLEKVLTNENLRKDFEEKTRNKIKEFDSSFVVKEFEKLL